MLRCGISKALAVVLVLLGSHSVAEETSVIQTTLVAEIRADSGPGDAPDAQRLIPAAVVTQGEVVYYTVQIRNPTSTPLRDVVVVQRIPANTAYVLDSASGPSADITFSVDGGQTFWREKELVVAQTTTEARKAKPEDYTHIRWQLRNALAPGSVALARFQAVFR